MRTHDRRAENGATSRCRVLMLPPIAWLPARAAWRPDSSPDPAALDRALADHGVACRIIDPLSWPWNPFARSHPLLRGVDPLRALLVLFGARRFDAVLCVFEGPALPLVLLRRLLRFSPRLLMWDIGLTDQWRLRQRVQQAVVPRLDEILVLGSNQLGEIARRWPVHPPLRRIGYSVDTEFFRPMPRSAPGGIFAVGDDDGRDYPVLLAAVRGLGVSLTLRSGRPLTLDRATEANVRQLRERVTFPELRQLYADADVVALPLAPRPHAGGVTSLLEACAMGCAIVVGDSPGVRDWCDDGQTCLVVPCGDAAAMRGALLRLLADPDLRARLGQNARAFAVRESSVPAFAARLAAVLKANSASLSPARSQMAPAEGRVAVADVAKSHFRYIDCVRGYAILMVIVSHATYRFPNLPWPIRRLTETGWFGVQLFFLASAVTLLFSWHGAGDGRDARAFFIRRFFRIAPAYYLAGVLYYLLDPPPQFDILQVLRTATFVNAFTPAWLTAPGAWNIVPGGWSISVEFTFYALFPLYAVTVTSLRRAVLVLAASLVAGVLANRAALHLLAADYPATSLGNFLFFWFANQASVFALGGVCYFVLRAIRPADSPLRRQLAPWSTTLALGCLAVFCALSLLPLGHFLGDRDLVPAGQLASVVLAGFVIALSANRSVLTGRAVALMGQVSFSAYLLHYLALRVVQACPRLFHVAADGVWAIVAFAGGLVATIVMTFAAAWLSYRSIELPMIGVGRRLCRRLSVRAPAPRLSPR